MNTTINRRALMRKLAALSLGGMVFPYAAFSDQSNQNASGVIHIPAGGGKKGTIGKMDIRFKFSGKQTGNHMGLWETVIQPGELGAPPHYHAKTDEICRVLEGTVTIMTGNEIIELKAGDWHLRPKNIVHTFWNSGNVPAKTIDLCIPAGHENYMEELAGMFENGARPKPGDFSMLEKKHDIHFRFDLLQGIMEKYGVAL